MDTPDSYTPDKTHELDAAYGLGYVACGDGVPITANPYPIGSTLGQEWQYGWQHYNADYNADYYTSPMFDGM